VKKSTARILASRSVAVVEEISLIHAGSTSGKSLTGHSVVFPYASRFKRLLAHFRRLPPPGNLLQVGTIMEAGMVSIDSEGDGPKLMLQGHGSAMVSVRLFVSLAVVNAFLEFALRLAQVMHQAGEPSLLTGPEERGKAGRIFGNALQVVRQKLILVR
jgi:hypothetical protein